MKNSSHLEQIYQILSTNKNKKYKYPFGVPGLWLEQKPERVEINPYNYFIDRIDRIRNVASEKVDQKEPSVYNLFVRLSCAYDHNNDKLLQPNIHQFRETGTFLKAIALLPYIKNLGVNTIYLLPVSSIGQDEKKGDLGSPYAIRNPYKPDQNLAEPLLKLDVETEFAAFTEAVHLLGMKLVCEFVFRTASIDSDISLEHPDWFYWINSKVKIRNAYETSESKYGPPIFLKKELELINRKVQSGDFSELIPPHDQFKKMFTEVPKKVARVDGKIRGLLSDKKTEVVIPGAFADWPPDDSQPAWTDVTFLRLYDHNRFNYIAYNTIRMYDEDLQKPELAVKDLWDYITGIIPHYIFQYKLDGVMIDMGHALPSSLRKKIIDKAKERNSEFFFWEENFSLSQESINEGYSAVLGYMPFDAHHSHNIKILIDRFNKRDIPVNFFATSETHNTPRSYSRISDINYLKSIYAFSLFLPAMTFIHSGFEIAEIHPVNTGLDFTSEQMMQYPPEKLGLFSSTALNWDNEQNIAEFINQINIIKKEYIIEPDDIFKTSIQPLHTDNNNVVGFIRRDPQSQTEMLIVANFSPYEIKSCLIDSYHGASKLIDVFSKNEVITNNGKVNFDFGAYQLIVFKIILEL